MYERVGVTFQNKTAETLMIIIYIYLQVLRQYRYRIILIDLNRSAVVSHSQGVVLSK